MKKIIISILILMFALSTNTGSTQTFISEWNNNTNIPWLGAWNLTNNDIHLGANLVFGSTDKKELNLLNINNSNGWVMVSRYSSSGYFRSAWNNGGNNIIGNWYLSNDDKYITLFDSFYGTHNLLAINSRTRHAQMMSYSSGSTYPTWNQIWGNNATGWINGWLISDDDRYLTGNFEINNTYNELVCINTRSGWISISNYNGGNFVGLYSNSGSGSISGWIMRNDDIYLSGDIDGDNKAELIAINAGSKCSAVFKLTNGNLTCIWYNYCNPNIGLGGWTNFYNTKFIIHDFDKDNREEIMFVNSSNLWCTIKRFDLNSQYWPDYYCNNGNGSICGWPISGSDKYIAGNFGSNSNRENLLCINAGYGLSNLFYTNNPNVADNVFLKSEEIISISPNPFNMQTKLSINIQRDENVKIIIYDILGKEIKLINNSVLSKGTHSFVWDGTDNNNNILSSGNYFLKVMSKSSVVTRKLVINK